jgi:hypothetical protein
MSLHQVPGDARRVMLLRNIRIVTHRGHGDATERG